MIREKHGNKLPDGERIKRDGEAGKEKDPEKADYDNMSEKSVARIIKLVNRIRAMLCIPKEEGKI